MNLCQGFCYFGLPLELATIPGYLDVWEKDGWPNEHSRKCMRSHHDGDNVKICGTHSELFGTQHSHPVCSSHRGRPVIWSRSRFFGLDQPPYTLCGRCENQYLANRSLQEEDQCRFTSLLKRLCEQDACHECWRWYLVQSEMQCQRAICESCIDFFPDFDSIEEQQQLWQNNPRDADCGSGLHRPVEWLRSNCAVCDTLAYDSVEEAWYMDIMQIGHADRPIWESNVWFCGCCSKPMHDPRLQDCHCMLCYIHKPGGSSALGGERNGKTLHEQWEDEKQETGER